MSATAYPLPLALSQPVPLAADFESALADSLGVGHTKYDPETQMRAGVVSWRQGVYDETQRAFEINFTYSNSQCMGVTSGDSSPVMVIDDSANIDEVDF